MKKLLIVSLVLVSGLALTAARPRPSLVAVPHLDLEMTGQEYRNLLGDYPVILGLDQSHFDELQPIIDMGKRNLDWLNFMNQFRDDAHKLSFSSKETQTGIPIDHPRKYNPQLIRQAYDDLLAKLPQPIKDVILGGQPFTQNPPMNEADYLNWGRELDSSYQIAARWYMMAPFLAELKDRQYEDIRGYYFLSQIPDVENQLRSWNNLSIEKQQRYRDWLVGICMNSLWEDCADQLTKAEKTGAVLQFYQTYIEKAQDLYNAYFLIPKVRHDITWAHSPERMHVPFVDPRNEKIKAFLSDNIQDEWHMGDWALLLDFVPTGKSTPHMVFEAGATPHVNGIAGDTITMDENSPLTEYNVQWTIRHEFGHVLGFPDCYVEFYDPVERVIVSYQLDITNLMCSRRGHLQQRHVDELRRVYGLTLVKP